MLEAELLNSSIELDGEINSSGQIDGNMDTSAKDYRKLSHLPYINGVKVEGNLSLEDLGIENYDDTEVRELIDNVDTKVDDLSTEAHQGFNVLSNAINNLEINKANRTEVDALSDKVDSNTAQIGQNKADISTLNDKVDNIHIPTKTSELTNDSGFITNDYHDDTKQDTLVSGTNIKTVNNQSLLGRGNITIESGAGSYPDLTNKPKINNVELIGNKSLEDIGVTGAISDSLNDFAEQLGEVVYDKSQVDTLLNNKADYGFDGIIDGTSANPTNGATLPNGVYKASESQNTSYISLPMEDGTTKRQSVQKGGIVIRTAARLEIYATQILMYQYDTSNQYFYPAESLVESNLRREYDDGLAYLGTVSPPNNVFITTPITELEATINTGDTGHVRITFTVDEGIASGDFGLTLTDTDGNEVIYENGIVPKPVSGETWILEFYGNTCEAICFKTTDGKSREDLLRTFMRRNSNQIYFPDVDGKPNVSIMAAKGYEQDRRVGLEAQNIEFTNFQNWTYYGIPNYVPLDLSLYNTSTQAKMLHPYTELPDGDYWVKSPGRMWLGNESYTLSTREHIHKNGPTLSIWGGEYACAYYAWNATDEVYEGGFFITYQDLIDYISEQSFEKGYTITRQTTATGSIVINDGRHYKRVRETGVTSLTFSLTNNLGEVPDTFKARVTLRTATTFTTFNITQRDAYKLYFVGDDCANGVITGVANKYYDIEFKADGFGDVVGIVHSYELPTT